MKKIWVILIAIVIFVGGSIGAWYLLYNAPVSSPVRPPTSDERYIGPAITHSWYSSLFFDTRSQPLFALPSSYRVIDKGLEIGTPRVSFSDKTIHAPHIADMVLSLTGGNITEKQVVRPGEWDVSVRLINRTGDAMRIHMIKGSPAIYVTVEQGSAVIEGAIRDVAATAGSAMTFVARENPYMIVAQDGAITVNKNTFVLPASPHPYIVMALPSDVSQKDQTMLERIATCAAQEPNKTSYDIDVSSKKNVSYVTYMPSADNTKEHLMTIWPHMRESLVAGSGNISTDPLGTYKTVRGTLTLVCTKLLVLDVATTPLPASWSAVLQKPSDLAAAQATLRADIMRFSTRVMPDGVYFKGRYLVNLTDLWELTQLVGLTDEQKQLEEKIRTLILAELPRFRWDDSMQMLMHAKPEFGHEKGNDHHFQYAYYLNVFARTYDLFAPDVKQSMQTVVGHMMVEGLPGVTDTAGALYPRKVRFFDPYEGHSWADAQALFADGNNQESTSEALFYWYAVWLWGQKQSLPQLSNTAQTIFFIEQASRDAYWFLVHDDWLTKGFSKPMVSLVWGGKADYATWFSPDEDKILGIQLLPITPASMVALSLKSPKTGETLKRFDAYYDKKLVGDKTTFLPFYLVYKVISLGKKDPLKHTEEFIPQLLYDLLPD